MGSVPLKRMTERRWWAWKMWVDEEKQKQLPTVSRHAYIQT